MNKKITLLFNLIIMSFLLTTLTSCPGSEENKTEPENHSLKILATDAVIAEKDEDGKNRISEDLQKLCEVLVSEQEDCNKTIVPEPTLIRVDTQEELSLKTILKSFSGDVRKVKVIQKLINKNFKNEIEIPKSFLENKVDSIDAFSKLNTYILTKTVKDSILFYSQEAASKYYTFNNLKYKFYDNIDDIRKKMLEILCKNDKASFVLVINPPDDEEAKRIAEKQRAEEEARRIAEKKRADDEARRKAEGEAIRKTEGARTKGNGKGIIFVKSRKDKGFLDKDKTVDEMRKNRILTNEEVNGHN